jgi:pyridoxamine 5'-phosphate oxidase
VRLRGTVEQVSAQDSDEYFASRPRGSQIGAWASLQSESLDVRRTLEQRVQDLETQFAGVDVPRPPHWGGWRITPQSFEFWQGRPSRLHDRFAYTKQSDGSWRIERLYP